MFYYLQKFVGEVIARTVAYYLQNFMVEIIAKKKLYEKCKLMNGWINL